MILKVGLTGGIASGKSTARKLFETLGAYTIDADRLVADLYEPGQDGHAALVATYGPGILREDQSVDRAKLAGIAFASPDEAKKLNALIHPIVHRHTERLLAEYARTHQDGIVVVEATLMLESGSSARYDKLVIVDVDPAVQVERGVARGLPRDEVLRRIANQMPREQRLARADYVIDNSGDTGQLEAETRRVYALLREELERRRTGGAPNNGD